MWNILISPFYIDGSSENAPSRTPEETVFSCSDAGVDSGTDCVISDDAG